MITPENLNTATIFAANTASGLSLGLSVTVLHDVLKWKVLQDRLWLTSLLLVVLWMPFVLSESPDIRRIGGVLVSLYLAGLFVAYDRRTSRRIRAKKAGKAAQAAADAVAEVHAGIVPCPIRMSGGCVPAQRGSGAMS